MSMLDILEDEEAGAPEMLATPAEVWAVYEEDQPDVVCVDTESRDTYRWHLPQADPFCFTFSWGRERTFYVPIGFPGDGRDDEDAEVAELVRRIMLSTPTITYHNAKYDLHVTKRVFDRFGLPLVTRRIDDTMIMSPVLNEHRYHGLKELCDDYRISFDDKPASFWRDKVQDWRENQSKLTGTMPGYHEVPLRLMVPYASQDAYLTWELFRTFEAEMDTQMETSPRRDIGGRDVRDIYELEMRLLWVFFQAEERGMRVDRQFVLEQIAALTPQLEDLKAKCHELVGWHVNPGSTDDVAQVLTELKVDTSVWVNPRTGKEKLPEWVLEGVIKTHEDQRVVDVCHWVLEYRTAQKLLSTYFESLRDDCRVDEDGQYIIRCNVKQTGARTGRTSVTDPPLQTLPRTKGNVREAFIAREGHQLIFADYSQQELRVLAHYMEVGVNDKSMSSVFRTDGSDLHVETAVAIFKVPADQLAPYMRPRAKDTNFAIVYGAGVPKMKAILGAKTDEEGDVFLKNYHGRFPGIRKLKYATKKNMEGRGFVLTLFGRRHRETDGRFTYKAINSLVQGTSADLTKAAMVRIDERLHAAKMRTLILLMVHDEIILEAPDEEVDEALEIVKSAMREFDDFVVPLEVDAKVDRRWRSKEG